MLGTLLKNGKVVDSYKVMQCDSCALIQKFDGGPTGIETLSSVLGEERETLEDVYEPYLIQEGFLQRTPRGRVATRLAYEHLGEVWQPQV